MSEDEKSERDKILESVTKDVTSGLTAATDLQKRLAPAWLRVTQGEPRWPASIALAAAIGMQYLLPHNQLLGPRWLIAGVAVALLIGLGVSNPKRIDSLSPYRRATSLLLIGLITLGNAWAAIRLVDALIHGHGSDDASSLLLNGASVWLTNVIAFALWYWEFDRGGPAARALAIDPYPDFLFPQMQNPELVPPHWEPGFADYLFLSFTNATAFSPTDVLPVSRWAKMTMMCQSAIALITVALVIARAVNVLK